MGHACAVVSDETILRAAPPQAWAPWRSRVWTSSPPSWPKAVEARAILACARSWGLGASWRPLHRRATPCSARDDSMARAWRGCPSSTTPQGTDNVPSPATPGRPSVLWPACRHWRVIPSQRVSHGQARLRCSSGWGGHVERDAGAMCACAWTDPRRTIAVCFHRMLLRGEGLAYRKTSQKAQPLFTPRCAPGAPWVGSADCSPQPPLRDTLYLDIPQA